MTPLLWSGVALVALMTLCLVAGLRLAAAAHIDPGDIENDEADDEWPASSFFPIRRIDPNGAHDRYAIPETVRRVWIDYLDEMWELPAREPGATR